MIAIAEHNDQAAFEEIFTYYFPGLVSFAGNIVSDKQLAEEVVADVFLKMWQNRKTLISVRNFSHYLYTATKYTAISALRAKQSLCLEEIGDDLLLTYTTPEAGLISDENVDIITKAINSLPAKCRLIFRLVKEEGLKYNEVANLLQLSVKTVESQMTIALKRVSDALEEMLSEFSISPVRKKA